MEFGGIHLDNEEKSYVAIVSALFENYESLYAVDAQTSAYQCFHESDSYSTLRIESCGEDFFADMNHNVLRTIYKDDQDYVRKMLSKEALQTALAKDKFYSFVYRLMINGNPLYHKLRATTELVEGRPHFLIGIRNIDAAFREAKAQTAELSSMHSKEINHLEAVLASAAGYLEANLTQDKMLEISLYKQTTSIPSGKSVKGEELTFSQFGEQDIGRLIVENKKKFLEVSDRQFLIRSFERGDKRATVSFSMKRSDGQITPCRIVFFLYQDASTGDILSFCVLYDLTEQQRKEKELQNLEKELQMSRLRNFTSQMQPHFLYNALGSIQEIVLDNPEYASELIGDFTIHLRSCIRAMANDVPIPFDQELANIKAYINIEKMRFGDRLHIVYEIQTNDFSILPLSVQPIVENAIRHGIYERGEKGGTVTIKTKKDKGSIVITVQDDGVGFDVEAFLSGISSGKLDSTGLKNIMFRLDKMMHATVRIESRINTGTTVTITIPKEDSKK